MPKPMPTSRNPPAGLRSLTPAAADAVARVHLAARAAYYSVQPDISGPPAQAEAYSRMWQSRLGQEDWQLTGAYSGQELVGFTAVQLPPASHALHLVALYVDPASWGVGIGSLLHDAVLGDVLGNAPGGDRESDRVLMGHSRAELEVWSLNHRALEFYVRRGWEIDGRTRPAHAGTHYLGMVLRSPTST